MHEFLRLRYDIVNKTWEKATVIDDRTEGGTHWERISETEAKEIQAAYVPMPDYDMTPLTEFLNH